MTNFSNEELVIKLADAEKKIKDYEEKERINYIKVIKKFGNKYSDEELAKIDLKTLEIVYDAGCRFYDDVADPSLKPEILPLGTKMKKDTDIPYRIDFANVFEDVAKEFDMSKIKYSGK